MCSILNDPSHPKAGGGHGDRQLDVGVGHHHHDSCSLSPLFRGHCTLEIRTSMGRGVVLPSRRHKAEFARNFSFHCGRLRSQDSWGRHRLSQRLAPLTHGWHRSRIQQDLKHFVSVLRLGTQSSHPSLVKAGKTDIQPGPWCKGHFQPLIWQHDVTYKVHFKNCTDCGEVNSQDQPQLLKNI